MAAIADLSDLVNRMSGGSSGTPETIWFNKIWRAAGTAMTATVAGRLSSMWLCDGNPSAGVAPTTVAIPDNTTNGGLKQADPGGGRQKWLVQAWASSLNAGNLILYDRLLHIGSLSGTVTTAQTVGGTLTRYNTNATCVGNIVFAEVYTAIGATARNITMSYTDQTGTSGNTSTATQIGATGFNAQSRAIVLPLASGDTGVQAVASVTIDATTGTAGNFGITIGRPLAFLPIGLAGSTGWRDFTTGMPGLPEILTDACLAFLWMPTTTTGPEIFGGISCIEA